MSSPHPTGEHDITIFCKGLKQRNPSIKFGIFDIGYRGEKELLSIPNSHDDQELARFKSHACLWQETINNPLKASGCMDQHFQHSITKHKIFMDAVAVICQYQMENGIPLFGV